MSTTDVSPLGTVLGIWAHPDDEVYLCGGLMAAARDGGQRVACVTATLGEHGTSDPMRWPPSRLARTRAWEIRAALAVLGVTEHHVLGLPDGGCVDEPFETVVDRLAGIIDEVRPDTILTFGPDGMTGHSDHQVVSAWATAAHARTGATARLLYATTTPEMHERWGYLYDGLDVFLAEGLPVLTPRADLALQFEMSDELADRKLVALRAQATQTAGLVAAIGEDAMRGWCSVEEFVEASTVVTDRAWATWRPTRAE
jgi:LmbE family N-acetylglucosaminyl deacetylase